MESRPTPRYLTTSNIQHCPASRCHAHQGFAGSISSPRLAPRSISNDQGKRKKGLSGGYSDTWMKKTRRAFFAESHSSGTRWKMFWHIFAVFGFGFSGPTAHPIPALGSAQGHAPSWDSRAASPAHARAGPMPDASCCGLWLAPRSISNDQGRRKKVLRGGDSLT